MNREKEVTRVGGKISIIGKKECIGNEVVMCGLAEFFACD